MISYTTNDTFLLSYLSDFVAITFILRAERGMQETITLACTVCKRRNYTLTKNKKKNPDRLELKKFCKFCRKHTLHKEIK